MNNTGHMNGGIDNMKTCVNVLYLQSRRWLAWHGAVYIFISEHAMAWCVPLCESVWYEYVCEPPPHQPSPFLPYTHTLTHNWWIHIPLRACVFIYVGFFLGSFVRSLLLHHSFISSFLFYRTRSRMRWCFIAAIWVTVYGMRVCIYWYMQRISVFHTLFFENVYMKQNKMKKKRKTT